jgi:hypothetical protein
MRKFVFFLIPLLFIIVLFSIRTVSAQTCTPGDINGTLFCNSTSDWQSIKADGETCLNDYECSSNYCSEGICGTKFSSIQGQQGFLQNIWQFYSGEECTPGQDGCDGIDYLMCGSGGMWENQSHVNGKCGYSFGGGGSCTPVWTCTNWSNSAQFCGTRTCTDTKNCDDNSTRPLENNSNCAGSLAPFCGDSVCDFNETCSSCETDCGTCTIALIQCGDGICSSGESSYTCPSDCTAVPPSSRTWLFVITLIVIIGGIILLVYLLFRKFKKAKERFGTGPQQHGGPRVPPPPVPPQKPLLPQKPIPAQRPMSYSPPSRFLP